MTNGFLTLQTLIIERNPNYFLSNAIGFQEMKEYEPFQRKDGGRNEALISNGIYVVVNPVRKRISIFKGSFIADPFDRL